ncbi:MAG: hypothetical protein CO099_08825 [Bdellovibrio sp. CG_4_9_14_3_um_filter_39_7]|nr:MAG: hypothetical protein CO099_08825 [Bdellovibrio sp. CG_4_9_14_3_um_filter_39_7]
MLKRLLALSILISIWSSAQAACGIGGTSGGSKATWDEIMSCPELKVTFPEFTLQERNFRIDQLCITGELVRSKVKVEFERNKKNKKWTWFDYVFVNRVNEIEVCDLWEEGYCRESHTERLEVVPLKTAIDVYKQTDTEGEWVLYFTKEYELPTCKDKQEEY